MNINTRLFAKDFLPVVIVLVGAIIRFAGLDKGLPYTYYADEAGNVDIAQRIFKTGNLNPGYFFYPSLFHYLNALSYFPYYYFGLIFGYFKDVNDLVAPGFVNLGIGMTPLPSSLLMARGLTVLWGTLTIVLTFITGWRLNNNWHMGVIAATLLAFSPTHTEYSRYVYPHIMLTAFLVMVLLFSHKLLASNSLVDYLIASIVCGLSMATMYHGGSAFALIFIAHFLRSGLGGVKDYKIYLSLLVTCLTFLVLNPFTLLAQGRFLQDSTHIVSHYLFATAGHDMGGIGGALGYYLVYAWQFEGPLFIFATIETILSAIRRDKPGLLTGGFCLAYFVLISIASARNARTFLPLIPFLILLTSASVSRFVNWLTYLRISRWSQMGISIGLAIAFVIVFLSATTHTMQIVVDRITIDSRETARVWVERNLRIGTKIALEAYAPYVDPKKYNVQGFFRLIDQPIEVYQQDGFEYLIFSQGMFQRFYDEPNTYKDEIARYEFMFQNLYKVKEFFDGGYIIKIYRVGN